MSSLNASSSKVSPRIVPPLVPQLSSPKASRIKERGGNSPLETDKAILRTCGDPCGRVSGVSHVALMVKNPSASAGDLRDVGLISGLGRSPGEASGNPLQYSCLENPMDRGAWWATVHGVAKSQT